MIPFGKVVRSVGLLTALFALAFQITIAAGAGTLRGRVFDKLSGEALPGAVIQVKGSGVGMSTDLDGRYLLRNIPAGNQTIIVSYVGYARIAQEVRVTGDAVQDLDLFLVGMAIQGETVTVTGQARGQMSAINQQLSSNSIVNVVSADKMKELPDANIAESIGRLPGISLQRNAGEAYGIVVRGLSPKYNEVTIEGIPMSSTNYYDRSIDLSLLSDDLVRGVEVSKTLRPDLDADALGGTVNLTLKSADPGLRYNVAGMGGYNHLRDTYRNYKFSGSISDRFLDDQIGVLAQANIEQKQLPSDQFGAGYANPTFQSTTGTFYINTNSSTLTESNVNRHRYGASLILDYRSELVDVKFFNVYDQKRDSTISRVNASNFNSNSFQDNIYLNDTKTEQRTHSLQAMFKLGGTELPISLSYTKGSSSTPNGMEFDFAQTNVAAVPANLLVYGDPAVLINFMGVMNPANSTLWNMYIYDTQLKDESYDLKLDWRVPFKLMDDLSGTFSVGGKLHQVRRTSNNMRMWYDVQWGGSKGRRVNLINAFPFLTGVDPNLEAGIPAAPFVDHNYTRSSLLGYPLGPSYDVYRLAGMMNTIFPAWRDMFYTEGVASYNQNYEDKENASAGYVMGEFAVGNGLTIVPGVRYQDEITDISAYHIQLNGSNQNGLAGQAPTLFESKRNTPGWFPSVNVKYKAAENVQVMGAVFKSISLPSYGEVSPMLEYGVSPSSVTTGNPLLRPSTAWNFDLSASLSGNEVGLFTVNLFYKEISNLVYTMQNYMPYLPYPMVGAPSDITDRLPGPNYFDISWANANNATNVSTWIPMNDPDRAFLRGIELSWQTHLWYLPGILSGVVLDLNASYMSSRQYYPSFQVVNLGTRIRPQMRLVYQTVAGPLQDQPRATYNAILGWDHLGFSSRFSLRFQQQTLTSVDTQYGLQNSFYDDVLLLDISLKQQILGSLAVYANVSNINGHIDSYYFSHPAYGTYSVGQLPTSKQTYGWAAQLGISYSH